MIGSKRKLPKRHISVLGLPTTQKPNSPGVSEKMTKRIRLLDDNRISVKLPPDVHRTLAAIQDSLWIREESCVPPSMVEVVRLIANRYGNDKYSIHVLLNSLHN